jgi:hypothetical protein
MSERSEITLGLAITVGSLVMAAVGAFGGGRIALVRSEQKLEDHLSENGIHMTMTETDALYPRRTECKLRHERHDRGDNGES